MKPHLWTALVLPILMTELKAPMCNKTFAGSKKKLYQQGQELKMNKACPLCQFKCVADHILKAHMLRKHTSKGTIHILRKHLYSIKLNLTT